jgi:hypothetical protein
MTCQYFRSYYIAQSFLAAKKWTETIALYEKVLGYASTALTGFKKFKTESIEVSYQLTSIDPVLNFLKPVNAVEAYPKTSYIDQLTSIDPVLNFFYSNNWF